MTATTPVWDIEYQTYADPADPAAAVEALAVTADAAVQAEADTADTAQNKPCCRISSATVQNVTSGTETTLTWPAGSVDIDTDGMLNNAGTTSVITFTHAGIYLVGLRVSMNIPPSGTGIRRATLTHSDYGIIAQRTERSITTGGNVPSINSIIPVMTPGLTLSASVFQNSGSTLTLATRALTAVKLKDL